MGSLNRWLNLICKFFVSKFLINWENGNLHNLLTILLLFFPQKSAQGSMLRDKWTIFYVRGWEVVCM